MKASSAKDNSQVSDLSFGDTLHPDVFWSPHEEMVADDRLMKSIDDDLCEAEDLELEQLISRLTRYAPALNASVDELQDFRKILLEAACAISLRSRFLDQLRSFALTDDLTSLYNRRGLLLLGLQHLKLASRTGKSLLLFFVDIDQFKRVNDSLAHLKSDAFLIFRSEVSSIPFPPS